MDVDITIIDEETILLETPSSPSEGQVDVTVESDLGSTTIDVALPIPAAHQKIQILRTPKTPGHSGCGTAQSTGLTGAWLKYDAKFACPTYFTSVSSTNNQSLCLYPYTCSGLLDLMAPAFKTVVSLY